MSPVHSDEVFYEPIKTFKELMGYGESGEEGSSKVKCRNDPVPLLMDNFGRGKINVTGKSAGGGSGKHPLTLVCHDLKGGYGDDKFINGTSNMENYMFRHWLLTDVFVYFSHKFVTIPPLGWINAAHSHGVKILGTLITEWDDGIDLCTKILSSEASIDKTVQKLVKIAEDYGFDGYLLNIENKLETEQVPGMVSFAKKLTDALRQQSSKNLVIWYDSVTKEGELKWQDSLNDRNKLFFDVCDGIFLNYNWNDEKLATSVISAGDRKYDVFVGVDCWGRGCWGGGGTNTCLAVDKIAKHDLSYAIFAPGWTYESHDFKKYPLMDDELWTKCMPNFHFRQLTGGSSVTPGGIGAILDDKGLPQRSDGVSRDTDSSGSTGKDIKHLEVYVATDFSRGYGKKMFSLGKVISDSNWFNLSKQSFQPVIFCSQKCLEYDCTEDHFAILTKVKEKDEKPSCNLSCVDMKVMYDTEDGFNGGGALKISNSRQKPNFENPIVFSPLWFPMNIPISSNRLTLAVVLIWKSVSINHQPRVYLELGKDNAPSKKILLGSLDALATSVRGKHFISLRLRQFLQSMPGSVQQGDYEDMEFYFQKNNYDEKELNGWRVSCYLFDIDQAYDDYCAIKSLRVGADGNISLGFLSLGQITHY